MKLLLLKILLKRRAKDEGFTLPIVIALGLVMILLGAINITRANEENLIAISQNSRSDAAAIAELGVARYREMLDRNRILSVYDSGQWTSVAGEACEAITNTSGGWADTGTWRAIKLDETALATDLNGDGDTSDTDVSVGEYKLVSYTYDDDGDPTTANINGKFEHDATTGSNQNKAFGTLKVQGRTKNGAEGETQIEVKIPIRTNENELDTLKPVLWIENSSLTSEGNLTVNGGNVVLKNGGTDNPCDNPTTAVGGATTISDARNLPSVTPLPTDASKVINLTIDGTVTLPRGTPDNDELKKNVDDRYYYEVDSITLQNNDDVRLNGLARVVIYLEGNTFTINDNVDISAGTALTSGTSSANLEIYAPNATSIDIGGSGTKNIKALIHAPKATVNITATGTVNIIGALWAKDLNNTGGANVNITADKSKVIVTNPNGSVTKPEKKSYKVYSSILNRSARPITYTPENWKTEKVQ